MKVVASKRVMSQAKGMARTLGRLFVIFVDNSVQLNFVLYGGLAIRLTGSLLGVRNFLLTASIKHRYNIQDHSFHVLQTVSRPWLTPLCGLWHSYGRWLALLCPTR